MLIESKIEGRRGSQVVSFERRRVLDIWLGITFAARGPWQRRITDHPSTRQTTFLKVYSDKKDKKQN